MIELPRGAVGVLEGAGFRAIVSAPEFEKWRGPKGWSVEFTYDDEGRLRARAYVSGSPGESSVTHASRRLVSEVLDPTSDQLDEILP